MSRYYRKNYSVYNTDKEKTAKRVAEELRGKGIDVVDGLKPSECVGRLPLSLFEPKERGGDEEQKVFMVASYESGSVAYLQKATKEAFPDSYFLMRDGENAQLKPTEFAEYGKRFMVESENSPKEMTSKARMGVYGFGEDSRIHKAGTVEYDVDLRRITFTESGDAAVRMPDIALERNRKIILRRDESSYWNNVSDEAFLPGLGETFASYAQVLSDGYAASGSGVRLTLDYGTVRLMKDELPTKAGNINERLTLDISDTTDWYSNQIRNSKEEPLPKDISPLSEDELETAKAKLVGLKLKKRHWSFDYSATMFVTPAPKGTMRPVGHIVLTAESSGGRESAEIAVCRLNSKLGIEDVYIRMRRDSGQPGRFLRLSGKKQFLDELGAIGVLKADLMKEAKNMRNKYAVDAAAGGSEMVDIEFLQMFAKMAFGAAFAEQCLRLGYKQLASNVADVAAITCRGWRAEAAMQSIFPGFVDGARSVYEAFGMPKAWGRYAFELAAEDEGRINPHDINRWGLADAVKSLRKAYKLESALEGGHPSQASVPERAKSFAKLYLQLVVKIPQFASRLNEVFGDDAEAEAELIRSAARMRSKAESACEDDGDSRYYVMETFEAYLDLKTIGIEPESLGIYAEYGLPENAPEAALEMIKRRCKAAQEAALSQKDIIDEKRHGAQEEKFQKNLKAIKWAEYNKDGKSGRYEFLLPKSLYGKDKPFSIVGEAVRQNNCLRNYINSLTDGNYFIILMRDKAKKKENLVTIGINKDLWVEQTYAYDDKPVSAEQASAISDWVKAVNAKGKGELKLKRPGGWAA